MNLMKTLFVCLAICLSLTAGMAGPVFAESDDEGSWMIIESEGIGDSQAEAIQMAIQGAVTEAVGALVTAKTLVENGQIVQDSILSHSGGFVESYKVLEGPTALDAGEVHVRIKAKVGRSRLVGSLKEIKVELNEFQGQNLAAQGFSIELNKRTGQEIWGEFIDEFFTTERLYKPSLKSYKLVKTEGAASLVQFVYRIEPDWDYYFTECLPALQTMTEKTSLQSIDQEMEVNLKEMYFPDPEKVGEKTEAKVNVITDRDLTKRMQKILKRLIKDNKDGHHLFFLKSIEGNKSHWAGYTFEKSLYSFIVSRICHVGYRGEVKKDGGSYLLQYPEPVVCFRFLDDGGNEVVAPRYDVLGLLGPGSFIERREFKWKSEGTPAPSLINRNMRVDKKVPNIMLAVAPMVNNKYRNTRSNQLWALEFTTLMVFETTDLSLVKNIMIELSDTGESRNGERVKLRNEDPWLTYFQDRFTKFQPEKIKQDQLSVGEDFSWMRLDYLLGLEYYNPSRPIDPGFHSRWLIPVK